MKLVEAHVREFKSIWNSGPLKVDKSTTCLVGKNEAGKTALLEAIYRLNPIVASDCAFDVTDDYPRSAVEDYSQDIETGRRTHVNVIYATFLLEPAEIAAVTAQYGPGALLKSEIVLERGYSKSENNHTLYVTVPVNEPEIVKYLVESFQLPEPEKSAVANITELTGLSMHLIASGKQREAAAKAAHAAAGQLTDEAEKATALAKAASLAETEQAKALRARLVELAQHKSLGLHIWSSLLRPTFPKFMYFDDYYQMKGHENIQALKTRQTQDKLEPADHPLLGLIELARLDLDKILATTRTQELKNKLQGASNHLSAQILRYWSQNKHLRMNFDVRPALPGDPVGMQGGTNVWGEVFDSKHLVSTSLSTRSTGFVWFFSFLAWYSAVKKKAEPLVLLLDEPGLSLHGKAQEDLLRFFEAEIVSNPKHQLIYSTHSPFMVDPAHFDRVRIVQDASIDSDEDLPRDKDGTKVLTSVLEAGADSLFPLQSALGYEIYQTLFVGPNSLVVEGASDLLYIQVVSSILQSKSRVGLDSRWTVTPVGGADKVPTFAALIGAQKTLNVATLIDFQKSNHQMIENLYKKRLLDKSHVLTFADFTGTKEADIEDMFGDEYYIGLVNAEFGSKFSVEDIKKGGTRLLARLERHFVEAPLPKGAVFNHFRPARFLVEKVSKFPVPEDALTRFETAFKQLNALLVS